MRWVLIAAVVLLLQGCAAVENRRGSEPVRILPVGDSVTVGYTDNPTWSVPYAFGYRGPLYERLAVDFKRGEGFAFEFVGSSPEPFDGKWAQPKAIGTPDLRALGQDHHEGYGGAGTKLVRERISGWLETHRPDVILLMIGINDIRIDSTEAPQSAKDDLRAIVETVHTQRPGAHLIVAQTFPYSRVTPAIEDYNAFVRDLVAEYAAADGRVSTVDQYANFLTDPAGVGNTIDASLFSNGHNHPDPQGYDRIAQTWHTELRRLNLGQWTHSAGPVGEDGR